MLVRRILEIPLVYDVFQVIVGGKKRQRIFKDEYIGNVQGLRVLELGCGTSDMLEYLEECDYTGVDLDEKYIEFARRRHKNRPWAQFACTDLNAFVKECHDKFDLILMIGVIHHIDDDAVENCFENAKKLLKDDGRFISFDGVYQEGMSRFSRFLNDMDRGQYIRTEDEYVRLNKKHWRNVNYVCRKDVEYLPFHAIIFTNKIL